MCPLLSTPQTSEASDCDEGAVMPEKIHIELKAKYKTTKKELMDLREEIEITVQK